MPFVPYALGQRAYRVWEVNYEGSFFATGGSGWKDHVPKVRTPDLPNLWIQVHTRGHLRADDERDRSESNGERSMAKDVSKRSNSMRGRKAQLVREGLKAGMNNEEIIRLVSEGLPDYGRKSIQTMISRYRMLLNVHG